MRKVDILLDIMKPRTAATPVSRGDMDSLLPKYLPEPHFTEVRTSSSIGELRDPPPGILSYDADANQFAHDDSFFANQVNYVGMSVAVDAEGDVTHEVQKYIAFNESEEEQDVGCMHEFGKYLTKIICCAGGMSREEKGKRGELREAIGEAAKSKSLLEAELRRQLLEIQKERFSMELVLRQKIARELSDKVIRQAQLQSKLLSMIEQRVNTEVQLSHLEDANDTDANIPTAEVTAVDTIFANECCDGSSASPEAISAHPTSGKAALRVETSSSMSTSQLPFSPTHCFSPGNTPSSSKRQPKVSFFDDAEVGTMSQFDCAKKQSLSVVMEHENDATFSDECRPFSNFVSHKGVFETSE